MQYWRGSLTSALSNCANTSLSLTVILSFTHSRISFAFSWSHAMLYTHILADYPIAENSQQITNLIICSLYFHLCFRHNKIKPNYRIISVNTLCRKIFPIIGNVQCSVSIPICVAILWKVYFLTALSTWWNFSVVPNVPKDGSVLLEKKITCISLLIACLHMTWRL